MSSITQANSLYSNYKITSFYMSPERWRSSRAFFVLMNYWVSMGQIGFSDELI